jgi:hypothetical protein
MPGTLVSSHLHFAPASRRGFVSFEYLLVGLAENPACLQRRAGLPVLQSSMCEAGNP